MLKEAAEAASLSLPASDKFPRLQILSIAEMLGKQVEYPRLLDVTYEKAPKARKAAEEQMPLAGSEVEDEKPF